MRSPCSGRRNVLDFMATREIESTALQCTQRLVRGLVRGGDCGECNVWLNLAIKQNKPTCPSIRYRFFASCGMRLLHTITLHTRNRSTYISVTQEVISTLCTDTSAAFVILCPCTFDSAWTISTSAVDLKVKPLSGINLWGAAAVHLFGIPECVPNYASTKKESPHSNRVSGPDDYETDRAINQWQNLPLLGPSPWSGVILSG